MRLNEMTSKSIFQTLEKTYKLAWLSSSSAINLDYEFYYQLNGEKYVSPIIETLLESGKTEDEVLTIIANICITKYSAKWNRLYDTLLDTKYNQFEDYKKTSDRNTSINQQTSTNTSSSTSTYGFNSTSAVPKDTANSESNVIQNKAQNTGQATESVSGKLGGTSYQELAKKEVELRLEHNFIEIVIKDITSEMCLSIY